MINLHSPAATRALTLAVWLAVACSGWYWMDAGLRVERRGEAIAPPAASASVVAIDPAAIARVLGAAPSQASAAPAPTQRFLLFGVIAAAQGEGAALLAVDGNPPRPFAVGSVVAPGYALKAVGAKHAVLQRDSGSEMTIALQAQTASPGPGAPSVDNSNPITTQAAPATPAPVAPPPAAPLNPNAGPPDPTSLPTLRGQQR
ncbi:MAG: type II secretion system protein N [Pseudomonadota bacterium]